MKKFDSRLGGAALALAVAIVGSVVIASPAAAATGKKPASDSGEYCVVYAETGESKCFPNEAALQAQFAADGVAQSEVSAAKAGSSTFATAAAEDEFDEAGATVIGYFFADWHYQGTYFGVVSSRTCSNGGGANSYQMPDGWNDRVSSYSLASDCRATIYWNINYGGSSYGPTGSLYYVGSTWNDEMSSFKIYD